MSRNFLPTLPTTNPTRRTPTFNRRLAQFRTAGGSAAHPCPHALTTWDHIEDPTRQSHAILRRTLNWCERTFGHTIAEGNDHRSGNRTW